MLWPWLAALLYAQGEGLRLNQSISQPLLQITWDCGSDTLAGGGGTTLCEPCWKMLLLHEPHYSRVGHKTTGPHKSVASQSLGYSLPLLAW